MGFGVREIRRVGDWAVGKSGIRAIRRSLGLRELGRSLGSGVCSVFDKAGIAFVDILDCVSSAGCM